MHTRWMLLLPSFRWENQDLERDKERNSIMPGSSIDILEQGVTNVTRKKALSQTGPQFPQLYARQV